MSDLRRVERRMANLRMIREIVHSFRALSAVQYRHASQGLASLRTYADLFHRGLTYLDLPSLSQSSPQRLLLIVMGSDQGLCGPLTARVVERAMNRARELGNNLFGMVAIGNRTGDLLASQGAGLVAIHNSPASVRGIDDLVGWVAQTIGHLLDEQRCDGAEVVAMRLVNSGDSRPELLRVLPIDPASLWETTGGRPPREPQLYERSEVVAAAILREWTYIEVYRCALESLTSEHDARLRTTDAATHALDRKLEELRLEHNHLRQEAITEEILETVSGAEDLLAEDAC